MAENLRRAYSRRYIFKSWEEVYQLDEHLHSKNLGFDSDVILVFDSDRNHMIYRAEKTDSDWVTSKVSYKFFDGGWLEDSDIDPDLAVAYNLKYYFTDKHQIYDQGLMVANADKGHKFFLFDSEGPRIWTPNLTFGINKTYFDSERVYIYPYTRLKSAIYGYGFKNFINQDVNPLDFLGYVIRVEGENFVYSGSQDVDTREIVHGDFKGENPAALWVKSDADTTNILFNTLETLDKTKGSQQQKTASSVGCYGNYVRRAIASDSDVILIGTDAIDRNKDYKFHYLTEFGDSEIPIQKGFDINPVDSEYVPILSSLPAEVTTNFTGFDNNEEPWRVFDDSDNFGFKASLGVESGYIGYVRPVIGNQVHHLRRVIIANTPATIADNRPYDFDIEGKNKFDVWETIEQVRGFTGNTYNQSWDSEYPYYGFRVNFINCQPGFTNATNALEVKQIHFLVNTETFRIERGNRGIFANQPSTTRYFTLYDSEEVEGFFVGGGGGGGGGIAGGGGSGAGVAVVHSLILPPGDYRLQVGGRGGGGGSYTGIRAKNTQDGTDGGDTWLHDITNNRDIVRAIGGVGGDDAQETSANNYVYSSSVPGSTATFDNVNYTISATVYQGQTGPRGANTNGGAGLDGTDGTTLAHKRYSSETEMTEATNVFGSSGGGAGTVGGADGNGGEYAGDAVTGNVAIDTYGGGGGGAGWNGGSFVSGGRGAGGYCYIVFK